MKKLLLFSALFIAAGTAFATTQDDVAAVLAKTKYKNIMTFLGEVSIRPDFCANGIVYESVCPLRISYGDGYTLGRNWLSDTVSVCKEIMWVTAENYYFDSDHNYGYWDAENWHFYSDYVKDTIYYSDGFSSEEVLQNLVYYCDSL